MNGGLPSWLRKEIKLPLRFLQIRSACLPWLRRISKAILVLLGLLLIWFAIWRVQLYREINRRFRTIQAARHPASGQELNDWRPKVPDSENAALVMTQAFALLRTFSDARDNEVTNVELLGSGTQWSNETRMVVAEFIAMNAEALAKAREGIQRPRCRYDVDFSYGPDSNLSHLGKLKTLARVAALKAALDCENGRTNEWPDDVTLLLGLSTTLDDEAGLISYFVRVSLVRTAIKVTERYLNSSSPDQDTCETLSKAFLDVEKTNALSLALIGERAMFVPVFRMNWAEIQHSSKTGEDGVPMMQRQRYSGKPNPILWLTGFFERDLNFFLRVMETNIYFASLPPPASLMATNMAALFGETPSTRSYFFSAMLLPSFANCFVHEARACARSRLVRTALAVERFRISHGRLPEDLKTLAPQFLDTVPLDPFDGQPLRYRLLPKGYVIYSLDCDGHDDGARERPERVTSTDKTAYDITFTVER